MPSSFACTLLAAGLLLPSWRGPARAEEPPPAPTPTTPLVPAPEAPPPDPPGGSLDELDRLSDEPLTDTPSSPVSGGASSLLNPNISLIGSFVAAYIDGTPLESGGHEASETGLALQELELAILAAVDPYFSAEAYFAFSLEGVEVEEAFARTTALPVVAITAGKLRSHLGRHNRRHLEQWRFADQPLISKALLGGEGLAPLGVALDILPPLSTSLRIRIEGLDAGAQAHAHEGEVAVPEEEEPEFADRVAGMARLELGLALDASTSLLIGASGFVSGRGDETRGMLGGDVYLRYLPARGSYFGVAWQTEYLVQVDAEGASGGLYSELAFRLSRTFELAGRFDLVGLPEGELAQEVGGALALTLLPSEFSRLRLQGGASKRSGEEDPVLSVLLQLQFNLGPHGAHAF